VGNLAQCDRARRAAWLSPWPTICGCRAAVPFATFVGNDNPREDGTMRHWTTLLVGLSVFGFAALPCASTASAQSGGTWITLFDGKNLDQWEAAATPDASFAIDDGAVGAKKQDPKTTVYLVSKQKYKDFQLIAEFWVSDDANSGIFIRCEDPKKPGAKTCYECNIFDTRPDPSYGTGAIVYHAEVDPMPKAGG